MPSTTTDGAPYPLSTEPIADGANAIKNLAQWISDMDVADIFANRPAPNTAYVGRRFYATDTGDHYRDTGTAWVLVAASARAEFGNGVLAPAANQVLSLNAPTVSTPSGVFGRATYMGVANAALTVAFPGLYRLTAFVVKIGGASGWTVKIIATSDNSTLGAGEFTATSQGPLLSGTFRVPSGAGAGFAIQAACGSTDRGAISSLIVERVGP